MAVAAFDTYKAVTMLQKRGLSKEAAEGISDPMKEVTENTLVTKADLHLALAEQTTSIIKWMTTVLVAHAVGTAALTVALIELLQ